MHIKNLKIKKLFGRFNYDFSFERNEKNGNLFIFHGYNGMGKTQILQILDMLCKKEFFNFTYSGNLSYEELELTYSNNSILKIYKGEDEKSKCKITYNNFLSKGHLVASKDLIIPEKELKKRSEKFLKYTRDIDDVIPLLVQMGSEEWMDRETRRVYNIHEIISEFKDFFPKDLFQKLKSSVPSYYDTDMLPDISTEFIDTKRLDIKTTLGTRNRTSLYRSMTSLTNLSKIVFQQLKNSSEEYAKKSQQLDSLVVSNILSVKETDGNDIYSITNRLNKLQEKSKKLYEAGILDKQEELPVKMENIGHHLLPFLNIYCNNTEEKLSVFDDIYQKITILTDIINKRFRYKKIKMTKEGLVVQDSDNGKSIPLDALSSGEQHELYLFGSLIFAEKQPDIIFIDEPEISLHVGWQRSFIDDLLEINTGRDTQIMIATHSPQIISDKFDIAFDLPRMNQE